MKTAYFTHVWGEYEFLGFFDNIENALEEADRQDKTMDDVVTIDHLYRTIENAKKALNNIPNK